MADHREQHSGCPNTWDAPGLAGLVRDLVWVEKPRAGWKVGAAYATAPSGAVWSCLRHDEGWSFDGTMYLDLLAAKAAAQADYAARILAALHVEKVQALVDAVDDVVCGRGMFGVDAAEDLRWAMAHLSPALAALKGETE